MKPPGSVRGAKWVGPGLIVVGMGGVVAAYLDPRPEPSDFEFGLLYTVTRYDQALPLLGTGFAIAQLPTRLCVISVAIFVLGILSGSFISDWIASAISAHPSLVGYALLTGPACSVIVGMALAAPRRLALWLTPPAALLSGAALGLVVNFNDPSFAQWAFAGGAVLAGLWLVMPPLLTWRHFARSWFSIFGRIFGSWLIAIGAMLAAAQLIPRPPPPEEPAAAASPAQLGAPLAVEPDASDPQSDPGGLPETSKY
jgi:hypothetical protein